MVDRAQRFKLHPTKKSLGFPAEVGKRLAAAAGLWVDVAENEVILHVGALYRGRIPRRSIAGARSIQRWGENAIDLDLKPRARIKVFGVPLPKKRLRLWRPEDLRGSLLALQPKPDRRSTLL